MLHGYQKKIDGFLSDTKSDSTEKIRSGLSEVSNSKISRGWRIPKIIDEFQPQLTQLTVHSLSLNKSKKYCIWIIMTHSCYSLFIISSYVRLDLSTLMTVRHSSFQTTLAYRQKRRQKFINHQCFHSGFFEHSQNFSKNCRSSRIFPNPWKTFSQTSLSLTYVQHVIIIIQWQSLQKQCNIGSICSSIWTMVPGAGPQEENHTAIRKRSATPFCCCYEGVFTRSCR